MKNKKGCLLIGCLIWILIVAAFIIGLVAIVKVSINALFSEKETYTEDYTVSAGQTLWDIACENTEGNVSEYVYNLRKLNNIDDCIIYPGQVIKIIK